MMTMGMELVCSMCAGQAATAAADGIIGAFASFIRSPSGMEGMYR